MANIGLQLYAPLFPVPHVRCHIEALYRRDLPVRGGDDRKAVNLNIGLAGSLSNLLEPLPPTFHT